MATYQYDRGERPLDGYTIEYGLGRGGFGEVYYAVSDAGRQVALKAIQNYEETELRGIGHCMNLKSQHLVSIFDVKYGSDGMPWVIMEFVAGPSLRDLLNDAPEGLGPAKAAFFVRELAKGLQYLHAAGIVHRDMKPHNVFFEDGVVKIGDYSLSKVITASHRSGHTMTVGTVHYMAPEIGMGRYDKTVDIYALGVMLFEMLTGRPPYTGDSVGEVLMKHLSSTPDLSDIDEPFASVIRKAMQRDPADRYSSAEAMAAAIAGIEGTDEAMSGFGPAHLSHVAARIARRSDDKSHDSTSRVELALESTRNDLPASERSPASHLQALRADLRGLATATAILAPPTARRHDRDAADTIARPWKLLSVLLTFSVIVFVGTWLGELFQIDVRRLDRLSELRWGPFGDPNATLDLPSVFVEQAVRALVVSLALFSAALINRWFIGRSILPENGLLCRATHLLFFLGVLTVAMVVGLTLVPDFFVVNLVAVAMPLLMQNWCLLTSPVRDTRIRLGPVIAAGVITFTTAEFIGADSVFAASAVVATSLAIQVWARFAAVAHDKGDPITDKMAVTLDAEPAASQSSLHSLVVTE